MKRLWLPLALLALTAAATALVTAVDTPAGTSAWTSVAAAAPIRRPLHRPPPKAPEPWAVPADPIPVVTPNFQKLEVQGLAVRARTESRIPGAKVTLAVRALTGSASPAALSLLTGALLRVGGTTEHAGAAFPTFLARNGLMLEVTTDPDYLSLTVRAAADQLPAALKLLSGLATTPAYPEAELERSVQALRGLTLLRARQPLTAATDQLSAQLFGAHPYATQIDDKALAGLTREVLLQAHARVFSPNRAMLAITSQLEPAALQPLVAEAFKGWKPGPADPGDVRMAAPKPGAGATQVKVPVTGTSMALVAGRVVSASTDLDQVAGRVLARTLDEAVRGKQAGGATGRSGAALTRYADSSLLRLWAEGPRLAPLQTTLRNELARAGRGELSDYEINRARMAVQREVLEHLSDVPSLVEASMLEELQGHDAAWPTRQIELLRTLGPDEVRRVARTLLATGALTFVASGSEAGLAEMAAGSASSEPGQGEKTAANAPGAPNRLEPTSPPASSIPAATQPAASAAPAKPGGIKAGSPGARGLKGGKGMNRGSRAYGARRGWRGQGGKGAAQGAKGAGQGARRSAGHRRLPRKQPIPQATPKKAP